MLLLILGNMTNISQEKRGKKLAIDMKCICLQEDFLKDALMLQVRMLLDKRNLRSIHHEGDYAFAS